MHTKLDTFKLKKNELVLLSGGKIVSPLPKTKPGTSALQTLATYQPTYQLTNVSAVPALLDKFNNQIQIH